jgi:hypothetical protein
MECVYLDLGGGGMNGIIGKSDVWPKIFGLKVRCLAENIRFEIRKILDISGIIKIWVWTQHYYFYT